MPKASRPSNGALAARRRPLTKGADIEAAARDASPNVKGVQRMLAFPLLELIEQNGGRARPADLYDQLADRLSLPTEMRRSTRSCANGVRRYDWFPQQVRWARQTAVMQGLILPANRGIWQLTEKAQAKLGRIRHGAAYLVYSTDLGVALGHMPKTRRGTSSRNRSSSSLRRPSIRSPPREATVP